MITLGSHLGQTGNRENDEAHMVAYAGELLPG